LLDGDTDFTDTAWVLPDPIDAPYGWLNSAGDEESGRKSSGFSSFHAEIGIDVGDDIISADYIYFMPSPMKIGEPVWREYLQPGNRWCDTCQSETVFCEVNLLGKDCYVTNIVDLMGAYNGLSLGAGIAAAVFALAF